MPDARHGPKGNEKMMITGSHGPFYGLTPEEQERKRAEMRAGQDRYEESRLADLFNALGFEGTKVWREEDGSLRASGLTPSEFTFPRSSLDDFLNIEQ